MKNTITQVEFNDIFKLDPKCKVNDTFLDIYTNIIIGCYKIKKEFYDNKKVLNVTFIDGKKYYLFFQPDGSKGWRELVLGLGSMAHIFVSYSKNKKDGRPTPFWTMSVTPNIRIAYSMAEAELHTINAIYSAKYGVKVNFMLDEYQPNYWFFRVHGIKILHTIPYTNEKGETNTLHEYQIRKSITNQDNVWCGTAHKVIDRIISGISKDL